MAVRIGVTDSVAVSAVFVSYKQALWAHKAMPMNGLGGRMLVFQAVFQGAGRWPGWNRVLARSGLILEQGFGVVWPDLGIGFGSDCVPVWNTAGRQAYPAVDGVQARCWCMVGVCAGCCAGWWPSWAASWAQARGTRKGQAQDTAATTAVVCARALHHGRRARSSAGWAHAPTRLLHSKIGRAHTCGDYGARGVVGLVLVS